MIKLTCMEKFLWYSSLSGDLLVLATTVLDAPPDLPKLSENLFVQALGHFRRRHPLLSAGIVMETNELFLTLSDQTSQASVEHSFGKTFDSRKKLIEDLEAFNQKTFDYQDPGMALWRARLDKFTDEEDGNKTRLALTLIIPLFITDGINIVVLLVELVNIINALLMDRECEEIRVKHEIMNDFYELCEKSNLINEEKLKQVKSLIEQRPSLPNKFLFDPHLKTDAQARGLKICFFNLDSSTSQELVKACKARKVKVNGAIFAICLYALNDLYAENNLAFPKCLRFKLPANLRIRVSPAMSLSNMRHLINLLEFTLDSPAFGDFRDIWTDSAEINKQIDAVVNMEDGSFFTASHDFQEFEEFFSLVQDPSMTLEEILTKCAEVKDCDFMLSNIGTYAYEHAKQSSSAQEGPLLTKEIYFGDSLSSFPATGSGLLVHSCLWNNQLMFQVSANKASIDSAHVDRFVELFKVRASQCIKS